MNFEEFINTIKDTIKEYLPEDYRDAEVNILENRKLNTNYTGLTVTREGDTLAPRSISITFLTVTASIRNTALQRLCRRSPQ